MVLKQTHVKCCVLIENQDFKYKAKKLMLVTLIFHYKSVDNQFAYHF